jgi:hypothetical protein
MLFGVGPRFDNGQSLARFFRSSGLWSGHALLLEYDE